MDMAMVYGYGSTIGTLDTVRGKFVSMRTSEVTNCGRLLICVLAHRASSWGSERGSCEWCFFIGNRCTLDAPLPPFHWLVSRDWVTVSMRTLKTSRDQIIGNGHIHPPQVVGRWKLPRSDGGEAAPFTDRPSSNQEGNSCWRSTSAHRLNGSKEKYGNMFNHSAHLPKF